MALELRNFPSVRRFLAQGFVHNPARDAPDYGLVCLETPNQSLFVEPETGYFRAGRTIKT